MKEKIRIEKKNLQSLLLAQPRLRLIAQHVFVDQNASAVLQGRDQVPQDLDAVAVAPVVEDPAKEIGIRRLAGSLRREKVVRHELDAAGVFLGQRRAPLLHRARKIQHEELDVSRCLGQHLRDAALAAAHVHNRRAGTIDRRPIEAGDEVLQVPALIFGEEAHTGAEAAGPRGVLAQELVDREVGAVGYAEGGFVLLARLAILCEGVKDAGRGRAELRRLEADGVEEVRIRDHEPGRSAVTDSVRGGLGEDAVGHCVTEISAGHGFGNAARGGDLLVSGGSIDGYGMGELVLVDGTEGEDISPLDIIIACQHERSITDIFISES